MKKHYLISLAAVLGAAMLGGCSQSDDELNGGYTGEGVNVTFVPEIIGVSNVAGSRAAASLDKKDAESLTILAFQRQGDGKYKLLQRSDAEQYKNGSSIADIPDNPGTFKWENATFRLPLGTYRFEAFYNVGGGLQLDAPTEADIWENLKKQIVLKYTEAVKSLDVNEVFATDGNSEEVVLAESQTSAGTVTVDLSLTRVNARIDVRILKKYYANEGGPGVEQGYDTGDIFGGKTITKITTTTKKIPTWNWEDNTVAVGDLVSFEDANTTGEGNLFIGTSTTDTTFPTGDEQKYMDDIEVEHIRRGAAYYKGAYILPFVTGNATTTLDKVNFVIEAAEPTATTEAEDADNSDNVRNLEATKVPVNQNKVTLLTFVLKASSEEPDDKEDLFTPNVKYIVTIDQEWAGVNIEDDIIIK